MRTIHLPHGNAPLEIYVSQRDSTLDTFYRFSIGVYIFALVLVMYAGTDDPTIHIKDLLTSWAAGLLAGSYVVVCWITGRPLRRPAIFFEVTLLLLGFFLLSALLSDFPRFSLLETGQFFSFFALYWLASQVFSGPGQVLRFFSAFCAAVFVAGLYAIAQKAGLDPFPWENRESDTYTNLPATFGNPNYAAHAIILALIMIACLVRSGMTWAGWIFVPVLLFHFYSTGQRAGWIALAGAVVLAGIARLLLPRSRRPVLAATGTLVLFAMLGAAMVAGAMYVTQARTGHMFPLDLSLLLRYQSYVSATNMLFEAPVLGHGPAVYGLAYSNHWTPYEQAWFAQELLVNEHVHNDLLELAIDGGLAAAGLYLAMIVLGTGFGLLLVARGESPLQQRLGYTFAAFFTAFAIDGLFGFNLRVPVTAALFFIMMGILDGLWSADREANPQPLKPLRRAVPRVAFLLLLFLSVWGESRRFIAEYYFHEGLNARAASDFDGAMAAFERADHYAGWSWEIPGYSGLVELDRNRPDLALTHFETALARNPHAFLTHLPVARANLMLAQAAESREDAGPEAAAGFLEAARGAAHATLSMAPGLPAANDILGRVESVAAILKRDSADAPDPAAPKAHWEAARAYFQAAIDGGAREPAEIYRMLMRVESALGDFEAAERALAGALRTEPGDGRTWNTFLEFARKHGRFEGMRQVLYQTIDRLQAQPVLTQAGQRELVEAYAWLAVVLDEGFGDVQGTADALARAVTLGPHRSDLWNRYSAFAQKHDRVPVFDETLRASCEALTARGETPLPQVHAVDLALRGPASDLDLASRTLLAGLLSQSGQTALPVLIAYGWAASRVQAVYDRRHAEGAAPCESALNLGIVAANLGGMDLAATLLERAHGCLEGEQRAAAAVHWGDTLTRQGNPERALEILRDAAGQSPEHLDIQWGIARALARGGQLDESRQAYGALISHPGVTPQNKTLLEQELEQVGAAAR